MYSNIFSAQSIQDLMSVLPSLPVAIWETFYVTVVSTALSLVLGLPLGVLLVAGEKNGVLPLPRWLMHSPAIKMTIAHRLPGIRPSPGPPCGEKPLRLPRMDPCVRPFAPYAARMRSAARRALSPRWRHP